MNNGGGVNIPLYNFFLQLFDFNSLPLFTFTFDFTFDFDSRLRLKLFPLPHQSHYAI
jgi:hypothetical protein